MWRVVTALVGVLLAVLVLEVVARGIRANSQVSWSREDRLTMCVPDARRIWRYRPHYSQRYETSEFSIDISTNSLGLRDREPISPRVLAIGDSFTFGWGVNVGDRYSDKLAEMLGIEAANGGHWMYTFDQQFMTMRELVERFHPEVVVQGFYSPHVATLASHRWQQDQGMISAIHDDAVQVDADGALRFASTWTSDPPLGLEIVAFAARALLNKNLRTHVARDWHALLTPGDTSLATAWAMTAEAARETASFLRSRDIAYVPFIVPWNGRRDSLDTTVADRRLAITLAAVGIHPVDMEEAFRRDSELYFTNDPHWTAKGHRVAAELLESRVRSAIFSRASSGS